MRGFSRLKRSIEDVVRQFSLLRRDLLTSRAREKCFRQGQLEVGPYKGAVAICLAMSMFAICTVAVLLSRSMGGEDPEAQKGLGKFRYPEESKLFPLANEVALTMRSVSRGFCPFSGHCTSTSHKQAIVHSIHSESSLATLFATIFIERLVGAWSHDIVVVSSVKLRGNLVHALLCLNAKLEVWPESWRDTQKASVVRGAPLAVLPLLPLGLRRYDYLIYLPLNPAVSGAIPAWSEDDFGKGVAGYLLGAKGWSVKDRTGPIQYVLDNNGIINSRLAFAPAYVARVNYLPAPQRIFETIHQGGKAANIRVAAGGDPAESSPPMSAYTYSEHLRETTGDQFTLMVAARFLDCPSLYSGMGVIQEGKPDLTAKVLDSTVDMSLPLINAVSDGSFKSRYNEFKGYTKEQRLIKTRRVLTVWASRDYVDGGYAVLYGLRTIGKWDDDIVLLTDGLTDASRQALECLGVTVLFYSYDEFSKTFPWVKGNIWYLKLLPFVIPELRNYDIVQYLDLDVVITGPLLKRYVTDFEDGVVLLMEDNGWDQSIIKREFMLEKLADVQAFVEQFPGADDDTNGPNQSPSAGACFHAFLVSRLEPIDELVSRFTAIARDHSDVMVWGDQPLLMLAFWGRWRMRFGHSDWQIQFHQLFHPEFRHWKTFQPLRYVHTGGTHRPPLVSSPYKPIDTFTRMLAARTLACPSLEPQLTSS